MSGSAENSARPAPIHAAGLLGFPSSLPTILAHSGSERILHAKARVGIIGAGGGAESIEKTPEGTPFNVGVWVGPDGESVLAGLNPGSYGGAIESDLSKPLPPLPANNALDELKKRVHDLRAKN
jgi:alpha-mannosidase